MKDAMVIVLALVGILGVIYMWMKQTDVMIQICLRFAFGIVGIYLLNMIYSNLSLQSPIGLNIGSITVAGILGVPGILLLYGGTFVLKN